MAKTLVKVTTWEGTDVPALAGQLDYDGVAPALILGYVSPALDFRAVAAALRKQFPEPIPLVLTTTAGELCGGEGRSLYCPTPPHWQRVVLQSFSAQLFQGVEVTSLPLGNQDLRRGEATLSRRERVDAIATRLQALNPSFRVRPGDTFAYVLIDGLSLCEAYFVEAFYQSKALPCVLTGASAGAGEGNGATWLFDGTQCLENHAVLVLVQMQPQYRFGVFQTSNFVKAGPSFVVLRGDVPFRRITDILDERTFRQRNFVEALCETLNCGLNELAEHLRDYSFGIEVRGQLYVRSVARILEAERQVKFFCEVDVGDRLYLLRKTDLLTAMNEDWVRYCEGKSPALGGILNDCILRRRNNPDRLTELSLFSDLPVAGFSTFGEVLGLDLNESLTSLFFHDAFPFRDPVVDHVPVRYAAFQASYFERRYTRDQIISGISGEILAHISERTALIHLFEESSLALLSLVSPEGIYTYISPSCSRILGFEPPEIVGGSLFSWVHPEEVLSLQSSLTHAATPEAPHSVTLRMRRRNGTYAWLETNTRPLADHVTGAMLEIILVSHDISERKTAEEDLLKAQKLSSLGVLAGGIAHDVNNILAGMQGQLEMVRLHLKAGRAEQALGWLDKTKTGFDRGRSMTQRLLTFSKGSNPIRQRVCLSDYIQEWVDLSLLGTDLTASVEADPFLWNCECDVTQIGQAVNNVLINARQATPRGGQVRVRLTNRVADRDYVALSVSDAGAGIPLDLMNKVFDPFFTTKADGTGLGLTVSNSIVQQHGGRIEVVSHVGVGSTFTLWLPAVRAGTPVAENACGEVEMTDRGLALLLDDEEAIRESVGCMLSSLGYETVVVPTGRDLLDQYSRLRASGRDVGLFLLDNLIPGGMSGVETARELRTAGALGQIVLMSGYFSDSLDASVHAMAGVKKLQKPFDTEALLKLVDRSAD